MGVADHAEEGNIALFAVDDPVGIENFVTAVLGVDLREHDKLGIGWVAFHFLVGGYQVIDLGFGHRETPVNVGLGKSFGAFDHEWDSAKGGGFEVAEKVGDVVIDGFGHTVVQGEERQAKVFDAEDETVGGAETEVNAALDACHSLKGTVVKDVCCLSRPGRDRALTRGDVETAVIA